MCGEIDAKGQAMDAAFCFTQGAVRGEKDCQLRKRKKRLLSCVPISHYLSLSLKAATMFDNIDSFMLCGLYIVENNGGGCVYVYMAVVSVCVRWS